MEDVQLPGQQFKSHHPRGGAIHHDQVQNLKFIKEVDIVFDALLVEGLQDHMPGAVGSEAGPAYGFAGDVVGVAAKGALVDPAMGCSDLPRPDATDGRRQARCSHE